MSSCTSNLHPSSSSINLFSNNNNSPKPSLSSLRFFTSTSPSSSVAPLSFSTTNHALSSPFPSNHIQSRQLRLRCQSPSPLFQLLPAVTAALGENTPFVTPCNALLPATLCYARLETPGITSSGDATCVPDLDVSDSSVVISFCRKQNVGLVVVGPEVPLDLDRITEMRFYSQLDFERI
ncbi:unnamed protein product [Brassica oleracea]